MALGGGVWVTQNKTLPGSYINIISASKATATLGERGIVAIALPLDKDAGTVIDITRSEFLKDSMNILGKAFDSADVAPLREIFANATRCFIFDMGDPEDEENEITVSDALAALEPYDFNVLCAYTETSADLTLYKTMIKSWRDDIGKKCQLVAYNLLTPDYEGIVNVKSTVSDEDAPTYALTAWVAGALAGCEVNKSCTNKMYNGEYNIVANRTQTQLEACINNGEFVFHMVYNNIRVLEDINSLVNTTAEKGEDFKSNQTIRVIDQIANDIAKLFNTKYLGQIPNNRSGRMSLWADIVSHHRQLETIQAIENFDPSLVTVEQGLKKKAVVVNDVVNVTNAMSQLYMTVVIE